MRWFTTRGLLKFICLSRLASFGLGQIDIVCDALEGNQIDWDCVFGPGSLAEVHTRGGEFTTCPRAVNSRHPCSRFIVPKEGERSEVKVKAGPEGFPFKKNEKYIYKYSFRPKDGMQVGKQYTHFGQLKGDESYDGTSIIFGVPIFSLTANLDGLMVRFSNLETIGNFHRGLDTFLPWSNTLGQWVHVKITTVLGVSMKVDISGGVEGTALWPEHLTPIGWHSDAKMARLKLGLYHKTGEVADGEVEYRNIQIRGPNGRIRTSPKAEPSGTLYRGCFEDVINDRVLGNKKFVDAHMTNEMCEELCEGYEYFGTQYSTECFCGDSDSRLFKHGRSSSCNRDCGGDSRIKKCGGWMAISVFQYEGSPADIPDDTDYVGCFADDQNDRALTLKNTVGNAMTYQRCRTICDAVGARYFGVQYSKECFCGETSDDYDQHGNGICYMSCAGDSDMMCGGFNTMNVFRIT